MSLAYERYLTSGTDLHNFSSLMARHSVLCDDGCAEMGPYVPGDEESGTSRVWQQWRSWRALMGVANYGRRRPRVVPRRGRL